VGSRNFRCGKIRRTLTNFLKYNKMGEFIKIKGRNIYSSVNWIYLFTCGTGTGFLVFEQLVQKRFMTQTLSTSKNYLQ